MKGTQILTLKPKHLTPMGTLSLSPLSLISQASGYRVGIQLTHSYIQLIFIEHLLSCLAKSLLLW